MMRIVNLALVALVIAAATWTYAIKRESEQRLAEIRKLERQIDLERQTIDLLRADWAHLSHPQRLQRLVERYQAELGLETPAADQFVTVRDLPGPPQFDPGDPIGDIIVGVPSDTLTTGSVDRGGRQ